MRKFQELFYKIGRIVNYVALGVYGLWIIIETIRLIINAAGGYSIVGNVGSIITNVIFAGFAVALIFLDRKYANDALKAKSNALTPVIVLMVVGLFVPFWCYVVAGVFGIIAASQENNSGEAKPEEKKPEEEKKEEKAE